MPTIVPDAGARYFSKGFNDNHAAPALEYVWDSGVVWQPTINGQPGALSTGAWRPIIPSDLAGTSNVSVSGLSLTVGAVALTGTNVVTLTGNTPVSVVNSAPIPVSGVVVSSPSPIQAISGFVNVLGGNVAPLNVTGIINTVVTGSVSTSVNAVAITGAPVVTITGVLPVSTSVTVGNVAVTGFPATIAPLAISGVVQASVTPNNTDVVNAIATGNARELVTNILLSGVSGQLASNLTDPAFVTGAVSITNPLLAASGNVTVINTAPIPVSGVVVATPPAIQAISGIITSTITGFNTGAVVTTVAKGNSTAGNSTPSGTGPYTSMTAFAWGQALAANQNRVELFVQNIHTGLPLYVNLGSSAASTGSFSMILNPSTQTNWAGSSWANATWRGAVQVSGGAWIAWEI